jgi:hypothetical protein
LTELTIQPPICQFWRLWHCQTGARAAASVLLSDRLGGPDEGRNWTRENEIIFVYPSEIDERWLRRGSHRSTKELVASIRSWITG